MLVASSTWAGLISNGDLETAVSAYSDLAGNSYYSLDTSNNVIASDTQAPLGAHDGDSGRDANEWILTSASRGFTYSATGGKEGGGGFVSTGLNDKNAKPRGVLFFAEDLKATKVSASISIDIKLSEASQFMTVQLWGWNNGDAGPALSPGGATENDPSYFHSTPNDSTLLLDTTADTAVLNAWTTIALGDVELG
jgi:hypothetical protein